MKDVKAKMKELNVQLDNLCQVLTFDQHSTSAVQ